MDPISAYSPLPNRPIVADAPVTAPVTKTATSPPNNTGPPPLTLDDAIKTLAIGLDVLNVGLLREVDPDTNNLKITLFDKRSGEVIRTIPQESVLETARNWKISGSLFSAQS